MPSALVLKSAPRRFLAVALAAVPLALGAYAPPAHAFGAPESFAPLAESAMPAVVTIRTDARIAATATQAPGLPQLGPNSPFQEFFEHFFNGQPGAPYGSPGAPVQQVHALGSGFVIDPAGIIVTNNHVVADADSIRVELNDGTELPAELIGRDEKTDLAVLRVESAQRLPSLAWGNSDDVRVGDWVVAIGNPFGVGITVTAGVVSARGRDIHSGPYDDFIQVDAAINRGNSGGPLFDTEGDIVGVNTAIFSPSGGNVGIGFAIPSNQAKAIVAQLVEKGAIERGFIGVQIQSVDRELADALGLSEPKGALVTQVTPDSPAAAAGLAAGDVILKFGAVQIGEVRDLTRAVAEIRPGTVQPVEVLRNGKSKSLSVRVGKIDEQKMAEAAPMAPSDMQAGLVEVPGLGFSLADLDEEARARLGLEAPTKGVLIARVDPAKVAARQGLAPGDVIAAIDYRAVDNADAARKLLEAAAKEGKKAALLLVVRHGQQHFVAVPYPQSMG